MKYYFNARTNGFEPFPQNEQSVAIDEIEVAQMLLKAEATQQVIVADENGFPILKKIN